MGSHRAVFGSDFMGGVVREILDKARALPVHVAVVIHGGERPLDRVFAVVDRGTHGRAALDLALRVALRKKSGLHAVLVPEDGNAEDAELLDLIRDAGRALGRRLHTDVLSAPTRGATRASDPGRPGRRRDQPRGQSRTLPRQSLRSETMRRCSPRLRKRPRKIRRPHHRASPKRETVNFSPLPKWDRECPRVEFFHGPSS